MTSPRVAFTRFSRALALLVLILGAWAGCRCRPAPTPARDSPTPTLRLTLVSGIAGALEPCGCVKDMLGGVDHAAAFTQGQTRVPSLVLGAGPMLFMDPVLSPERRVQELLKAEAMARSLSVLGLKAWAPGANDFAVGTTELARLVGSGPVPLATNLAGNEVVTRRTSSYVVGGVRVGVTGISQPAHRGRLPEGVQTQSEVAALRSAVDELRKTGTQLNVLLAAMPRGEALRLAELVPAFQLMLIGKPYDEGEANDPITPPSRVGRTLVIESPNHLQAFYVVDLFVKDGRFEFENAAAKSEERTDLDRRVQELERRLAQAKANTAVSRADVAARERDLAKLKEERDRIVEDAGTPSGSHYRTSLVEVRESLGSDKRIQTELAAYYRRVNEHNKEAFKDRLPPPVADGQSEYIGAEQCGTCHQEEHAFWSKTRHAKAYETLSRQHKEFNLDCVSCHVTGYEQPGGSTVTHVESLKDVQCEVCHGPGSRHLANPADDTLLIAKPDRNLCGPKCHHVPHVKPEWSVDEAWKHIIGPGHGQ